MYYAPAPSAKSCFVGVNAAQAVLVSTTTIVAYVTTPAECFDPFGMWSNASNRFIAPSAGRWAFEAQATGAGVGGSTGFYLYKNGAFPYSLYRSPVTADVIVLSGALVLAAGDYLDFRVYSNVGGWNISANPRCYARIWSV